MKDNKRTKEAYLADVLGAIRQIESYIEGVDEAVFLSHSMMHDAVLRQVLIVGEATKYIGGDVRKKYPDIAWSDIVAMRNFISHEYAEVDLPLVWATIKKDLPKLKQVLQDFSGQVVCI